MDSELFQSLPRDCGTICAWQLDLTTDNINIFKSKLKTFLFKQAYAL